MLCVYMCVMIPPSKRFSAGKGYKRISDNTDTIWTTGPEVALHIVSLHLQKIMLVLEPPPYPPTVPQLSKLALQTHTSVVTVPTHGAHEKELC